MNPLKEYTITVSKKGDELVKWSGGEFLVCNIEGSDGKRFTIPKFKKDQSVSVAYEQVQKVSVGDTITCAVDEKEKTNKEGKTYTTRTIRSIKGDEHGTPHTSQQIETTQSDFKQGITKDRWAEFEARLSKLEAYHNDIPPAETDLNELPF